MNMSKRSDIKGYEGLYTIDKDGKVHNRFGHQLKASRGESGNGYYQVCLCKDGVTKTILVHRLVAITFIPNPENKKTVNHIDGDKLNNNVENLEWMTYSENNRHSINTLGNPKPPSWKGKQGKDHNRSKKVYEYDINGNLMCEYESGLDFQRKTGVHHSSITWSIKTGKPIYGKLYSREKVIPTLN